MSYEVPVEANEALRTLIANARKRGSSTIRFAKCTRGGNSPKNHDRCVIQRGRPSLVGRCIGIGVFPGQWAFEVSVVDAERFLEGLKK